MTRCESCRRDWNALMCLAESMLCCLPCLAVERWFFRQVGGWRERVATRLVQGYYGAGRRWPSANERKWCSCQSNDQVERPQKASKGENE